MEELYRLKAGDTTELVTEAGAEFTATVVSPYNPSTGEIVFLADGTVMTMKVNRAN